MHTFNSPSNAERKRLAFALLTASLFQPWLTSLYGIQMAHDIPWFPSVIIRSCFVCSTGGDFLAVVACCCNGRAEITTGTCR